MRLGGADKTARRDDGTAPLDVFPTRRGIEEHGDESQPEDRQQGHIQFDGHRLEHQHGIAGAQSLRMEQRRSLGREPIQFRKGQHAILPARGGDECREMRRLPRFGDQDFRDVHGASFRANSV